MTQALLAPPIMDFQIPHHFLNNFWKCHILWRDKEYGTVEHAYQASKAKRSWDIELIRKCSSPGNAKRLGRRAELVDDWEGIKIDVMTKLIRIKFSNLNSKLKQKLIRTDDAELIEGNHWGDTFWGMCNGVGENNLGKILMKIRAELN